MNSHVNRYNLMCIFLFVLCSGYALFNYMVLENIFLTVLWSAGALVQVVSLIFNLVPPIKQKETLFDWGVVAIISISALVDAFRLIQ